MKNFDQWWDEDGPGERATRAEKEYARHFYNAGLASAGATVPARPAAASDTMADALRQACTLLVGKWLDRAAACDRVVAGGTHPSPTSWVSTASLIDHEQAAITLRAMARELEDIDTAGQIAERVDFLKLAEDLAVKLTRARTALAEIDGDDRLHLNHQHIAREALEATADAPTDTGPSVAELKAMVVIGYEVASYARESKRLNTTEFLVGLHARIDRFELQHDKTCPDVKPQPISPR